MQYSPKLKAAAEEIKQVLKKYDIAATCVLHTPGAIEYLFRVDPSYSCAKVEGPLLKLRAKLHEDFKGDKKEQINTLTDTADMLAGLGMMNDRFARQLEDALNLMREHV